MQLKHIPSSIVIPRPGVQINRTPTPPVEIIKPHPDNTPLFSDIITSGVRRVAPDDAWIRANLTSPTNIDVVGFVGHIDAQLVDYDKVVRRMRARFIPSSDTGNPVLLDFYIRGSSVIILPHRQAAAGRRISDNARIISDPDTTYLEVQDPHLFAALTFYPIHPGTSLYNKIQAIRNGTLDPSALCAPIADDSPCDESPYGQFPGCPPSPPCSCDPLPKQNFLRALSIDQLPLLPR